jgi:hypothetical protein
MKFGLVVINERLFWTGAGEIKGRPSSGRSSL